LRKINLKIQVAKWGTPKKKIFEKGKKRGEGKGKNKKNKKNK